MSKAKTLRNYKFALPSELIEKFERHVEALGMPSLNDAVREAIEAYVNQLDRLQYRVAMQKAANDPDFRRDVEDAMKDFARIDQLKGG